MYVTIVLASLGARFLYCPESLPDARICLRQKTCNTNAQNKKWNKNKTFSSYFSFCCKKMNFKCYYTFVSECSPLFFLPSRLSFFGYRMSMMFHCQGPMQINMPHNKQNKTRTHARRICEWKSLHNVEIWWTDQIQLVCKFRWGAIADKLSTWFCSSFFYSIIIIFRVQAKRTGKCGTHWASMGVNVLRRNGIQWTAGNSPAIK